MKTTLSHVHTPLLLILLFSFSSSTANALAWQPVLLVQRDTASWNRLLHSSLGAVADSIGRRTRSEIKDLQKMNTRAADSASGLLGVSAERLIRESGDSLSPSRRESIRLIVRTMDTALASYAAEIRRSADEALRGFQKGMLILEKRYSNCDDCENSQDVQSLLDEYFAASDSLAEILHQSSEGLTESMDDSLDVFRDRLADACSEMIDRQAEENEYAAAHSSRLVISGSYISDVVYHGRDGGVKQFALSPQLAYKHRSGLFVAGSAAWLSNSVNGWDQRNVGGGYEFELGTHFAGILSYTHIWFSDSSYQEKAELTNSLDGELSLLTKPVNASISLSLAFATASEFTSEFSLSHEFDVDRFFGRAALSIEPTITVIVGEQNSSLTQKRLKRVITKKGKVATLIQSSTQTTNYFGILDYEFTVPFVLAYQNATFSPTFSYAIPINVIDASDTAPFFYFTFSASYAIR